MIPFGTPLLYVACWSPSTQVSAIFLHYFDSSILPANDKQKRGAARSAPPKTLLNGEQLVRSSSLTSRTAIARSVVRYGPGRRLRASDSVVEETTFVVLTDHFYGGSTARNIAERN